MARQVEKLSEPHDEASSHDARQEVGLAWSRAAVIRDEAFIIGNSGTSPRSLGGMVVALSILRGPASCGSRPEPQDRLELDNFCAPKEALRNGNSDDCQ